MHQDKKLVTTAEIRKAGVKLTPMMVQYMAVKEDHPETIVLFRMGDFYELFFEDAVAASKILSITLTHRGKLGDFPVPMAGIPHHAAATYIDRITHAGHRVAICEQVEDPKQAKGIVRREVTQIVSPGMPYDLEKIETSTNRYMACAIASGKKYFLTLLDFTTGSFLGVECDSLEELMEKIQIYQPKEIISFLGQWAKAEHFENMLSAEGILSTHLSEDYFDIQNTKMYLEKLVPNYSKDEIIQMNPGVIPCIGALAYYVCSTQNIEEFFHMRPFQMENQSRHMKVGLPTLMGLEIFPKGQNKYRESLLGHFDKTKSSLGSRALKAFFLNPLQDQKEINKRQEIIQYFLDHMDVLSEIRERLSGIRDLERILVKVSTNKTTAQDLLNLAYSVQSYQGILELDKKLPDDFKASFNKQALANLNELAEKIVNTLNDEIGASLDKGNLIKKGLNKTRDKYFNLAQNAGLEITALEDKYKKKIGVQTLRIKHNNVHGYFVEISKGQASKAPKTFNRIQTLVNAERFTVKELDKLQEEILLAKEKLNRMEKKIFDDLVNQVMDLSIEVQQLAGNLARLDIFQSLAWMALQEDLTRPNFVAKKSIKIKGGWHPLIKANINEKFISHDITLDEKVYFGLITGPNMAGKTTVMREVAIIQFLAQIGSYVPASSCELSLCDYIFSRLGAHDDIIHGQSTFMVEMSETASILRHATKKSLIILDEVGRGTSTYDGLSIAWALVEHFVKEKKSLCLFSTHYHELIDLADQLENAKNLTVETINNNGDVKFLYNLVERGASQSFGIYVAKLAGLPKSVLKRSEIILSDLEDDQQHTHDKVSKAAQKARPKNGIDANFDDRQLCFFDFQEDEVCEVPEHLVKMEDEIKGLNIMNMTPIEALQKLHEIQSELAQ